MAGNRGLAATSAIFVAYTAAMMLVERRLRATGGPGIVAFELAGNTSRAERIMGRWGHDGRRAARLSLWLDFGYMASYGALAALLVDRARRLRGHPAALRAVVPIAVAADAVEGISLLKVLGGRHIAANARRAQTAAVLKFALLACCLGYAVTREGPRPKSGASG